ncbi:UNVERIFIED_CONTAM: hypothetical protein K2H54_000238 [Gekko kuhli]
MAHRVQVAQALHRQLRVHGQAAGGRGPTIGLTWRRPRPGKDPASEEPPIQVSALFLTPADQTLLGDSSEQGRDSAATCPLDRSGKESGMLECRIALLSKLLTRQADPWEHAKDQ